MWRMKLLDLLTCMNFYPVICKIYFVCRGIRGKEQDNRKRDSKTFDIERLFEAVASRDVRKLDGLYQYLYQNMKKLSDSLCEYDRAHDAADAPRCKLLACVLTL